MQIVSAIEIRFGFKVDYICDVCSNNIKQSFAWLSFAMLDDNADMPELLCPICKTHVKVNLIGIERPFKTSAFSEMPF